MDLYATVIQLKIYDMGDFTDIENNKSQSTMVAPIYLWATHKKMVY